MGCYIYRPINYQNSPFTDRRQKTRELYLEIIDKVRLLESQDQRDEYIREIRGLQRNWNEDIDLISELRVIKRELRHYHSKYQVVPLEFMDDFDISTSLQSAPLILNNEEWTYFIDMLDSNNFDEQLKQLYSKKPENLTILF